MPKPSAARGNSAAGSAPETVAHAAASTPTPQLDALIAREPDLVDRIFEFILSDPAMALAMQRVAEGDAVDQLKAKVRAEFRGEECYITDRYSTASQVLALFNGRNATEVARRLKISRATVYRTIKQAGRPMPVRVQKLSQFSGK